MSRILIQQDQFSADGPPLAASFEPFPSHPDALLPQSSRPYLRSTHRPGWSSQLSIRRRMFQQQNVSEQIARHGDLRHLGRELATMGDGLRPDLDQLLPDRGQRTVPYVLNA